jgi:hypothetical protein
LALQKSFGIFAFYPDNAETIQHCQRISITDRRNLPEKSGNASRPSAPTYPDFFYPNLPRLVHVATPVISTPN